VIRVLHVFNPSFSGHIKRWLRQFHEWNDGSINHLILMPDSGNILDYRECELSLKRSSPGFSIDTSRWGQIRWVYWLLWFLASRRGQYDLIHLHGLDWGGLVAGPFAKLLQKPCLREISQMGNDNPSILLGESFSGIKIWCYKRCDSVLCISDALKKDCLINGFEESKPILLINPVNTELFFPHQVLDSKIQIRRMLKLPEKAILILFVGSIIRRKGVDLLVRAFISLAKSNPKMTLLLVGPSTKRENLGFDESFIKEIHTNIANAGLTERVIFTGQVDNDRLLADYYHTADLFAFPTRQEGLGNVILEAMSAGLPVISSYLPGITDLLIQDGVNGILIPPDDVSSLQEKIQLLLDHPEQGLELGKAARESSLQNFGFDAWQERLVEIYFSMVESKHPGSQA